MRRLWGLVSALGLLAMVTFGTWGCLTAGVKDPSASTSVIIAVGGGLLMVIGLIGRGGGSRLVPKARRILGAVGLCVAPVTAALTLLQFGTASPSMGLVFLLVTFAALGLWAQAIATEAGLPFGLAAAWLGIAVLGAAIAFPIALLISAAVATAVTGVGGPSEAAPLVGSAAGLAVIGWILGVWGRNRPDRRALPGALARVVLGRALPADRDVLGAGPGAMIRGRRTPTTAANDRSTTIAALDRRLGPGGDAPDANRPTDDGTRDD